uniref:Uncharacterized protein n=1 Tax=Anguilla anguilla TaxID=7936 RepID=A0A0E9SLI1_ANGAN
MPRPIMNNDKLLHLYWLVWGFTRGVVWVFLRLSYRKADNRHHCCWFCSLEQTFVLHLTQGYLCS